jgi:hypothetical protein
MLPTHRDLTGLFDRTLQRDAIAYVTSAASSQLVAPVRVTLNICQLSPLHLMIFHSYHFTSVRLQIIFAAWFFSINLRNSSVYLHVFNHLQDAWKLLTADGDKQWTMMGMRQLRNSCSLPRSLLRTSRIDLSQSCRSSARQLCLRLNTSTLSSLAHLWYAGDFGCNFFIW